MVEAPTMLETADIATILKALPHRAEFADTSKNATALPAIQNQRAVYNAMMTDFNAMWLTQADPQAALDAMQAGVERVLRRNR